MSEDKKIYEVATQQGCASVVNFEDYAMSTAGVLKQVSMIHDVMTSVMKVDEHFGTIPGTKKPSLYKAGAEKLSLTFRLRPEYEIRRSELPNGHREYEVVCTPYHIPTGQSVGQGVGSATTMEGKYRYRTGPAEFTGKMVPQEYWKERDISLIGGKGFVTKKNDEGKWEIAIQGQSVEHDNPADYYNTVLKMAKKRAHVDAILTATAASDIFTQDVEDMPEVIPGAKKETAKQNATPPIKEPQKKQETAPAGMVVIGKISDIETKPGIAKKKDKDGKEYDQAYTIYKISVDGDQYATFDDAAADLARSIQESGEEVKITFTTGKYGNKIGSLEMVSQNG